MVQHSILTSGGHEFHLACGQLNSFDSSALQPKMRYAVICQLGQQAAHLIGPLHRKPAEHAGVSQAAWHLMLQTAAWGCFI